MASGVFCEKCGHEMEIGEFPFCPHETGSNSVNGDECDVIISHGICNDDGTPRRYRSKAEMRKEAEKKGLVNHVVHVPSPGSDKNRFGHTQRWV